MRPIFEVVGRHPHFFLLHDSLLVEVGFAAVDEDERTGLAVVAREIHLLEPRWPIIVMLTEGLLAVGARQPIGREIGDGLGVGLRGGLEGFDGCNKGLHGGLEVVHLVAHGGGTRRSRRGRRRWRRCGWRW